MQFNRVWITGDTHGDFEWLSDWCEKNQTTRSDALIILGDTGILYYGENDQREKYIKEQISSCPITLICVRGNHEERPENRKNMIFTALDDDPVIPSGFYKKSEYDSILYLADGSTFTLNDKRCLAIGGAYSVDKEYRKLMGWHWFEDEELTDEEMWNILDKIDHHWFDYVFTHTCPEPWEPKDLFMKGIDQSKVSKRMEQFLNTVSEIIDFRYWYFGHYHYNRLNMDVSKSHPGQGDVSMLFNHIERLM